MSKENKNRLTVVLDEEYMKKFEYIKACFGVKNNANVIKKLINHFINWKF